MYGPLSCEPLFATSITMIVLISAVAVLSSICLLYHSCCTKENKGIERCLLSCCGLLFTVVFLATVVFGSYLIFGVSGNFDAIMHGEYLNHNGSSASYIDCHLTSLPLVTIISSYTAIFIYIAVFAGCCYYTIRRAPVNG